MNIPLNQNPFAALSQSGLGGTNAPTDPMAMIVQMMMQLLPLLQGMGNPGGLQGGGGPQFGGGSGGGACGCGGGGGIPGFGGFGGSSSYGGPGASSSGAMGGPSHVANVPPAGSTNSKIANQALGWDGKAFKAGQTRRCADWVSTVLQQSGVDSKYTVAARDFAKQGSPVGYDQLKAGDVVLFGNTYRKGKYTHVGIYVGDGKFTHRPTANKPVRTDSLKSGYYKSKFTGARRFPSKGE